jgi:hypothetical protein
VNCSPRPLKFLALAVTMHPDPPKAAIGVAQPKPAPATFLESWRG